MVEGGDLVRRVVLDSDVDASVMAGAEIETASDADEAGGADIRSEMIVSRQETAQGIH